MAGEHLPEDIIVKILSNLPVKSLIRFRCVSKRWRSIVSDPQFARLQFKVASEQQTVSRRILLSSGTTSQFESLDLETPSPQANSSCSIRRPHLPFRLGSRVSLLCSCNGLVCVALDSTESFYIWNPSIGCTHRLPDPFDSPKKRLSHYGFGYVSATDDYKLVLGADVVDGLRGEVEVEVLEIFSLRARIWRRIEADPEDCIPECQGVLLNEALHWINMMGHWYALVDLDEDVVEVAEPFIIAFDLAREEFWKMPVPIIAKHNYGCTDVGVSCDGCLYVICSAQVGSLEFWVMREYGEGDSWTKLFNLNTCEPPEQIMYLTPASAVVMLRTRSGLELVRIDHNEEKRGETSTVAARYMVPGQDMEMIGYEESLFWLSDISLCAFAFWGAGTSA